MKAVLFILKLYKKHLSPLLHRIGLAGGCRFLPTCSEYSMGAIEKFGVKKGAILSLKRILKCHPFFKGDYFDPVPTKS